MSENSISCSIEVRRYLPYDKRFHDVVSLDVDTHDEIRDYLSSVTVPSNLRPDDPLYVMHVNLDSYEEHQDGLDSTWSIQRRLSVGQFRPVLLMLQARGYNLSDAYKTCLDGEADVAFQEIVKSLSERIRVLECNL